MTHSLLYIDACVRADASRTKYLADRFVSAYQAQHPNTAVTHLPLHAADLHPLDAGMLAQRDALLQSGNTSHPLLAYARQFSDADCIVLAAPFWDLSFPSVVRVYLEHICANRITFHYNEEGQTVGDCRASRLVYLTTRGGIFSGPMAEWEQATPYLHMLCRMLGIPHMDCIAAEGLDIWGADVDKILADACTQAEQLAAQI